MILFVLLLGVLATLLVYFAPTAAVWLQGFLATNLPQMNLQLSVLTLAVVFVGMVILFGIAVNSRGFGRRRF